MTTSNNRPVNRFWTWPNFYLLNLLSIFFLRTSRTNGHPCLSQHSWRELRFLRGKIGTFPSLCLNTYTNWDILHYMQEFACEKMNGGLWTLNKNER